MHLGERFRLPFAVVCSIQRFLLAITLSQSPQKSGGNTPGGQQRVVSDTNHTRRKRRERDEAHPWCQSRLAHTVSGRASNHKLGLRMKKIGVLCTSVASALAYAPPERAAAEPATWVVDDDLQQCSQAQFRSIQEAVTEANAGDLIRVCPGLYTESVTIDKPLTLTKG